MPAEELSGGAGKPPFGDVLLEAVRGIRNEILLYGIAVLIILLGSAALGIEVLRELELPLLGFATLVLIAYLFVTWPKARERVLMGKAGK